MTKHYICVLKTIDMTFVYILKFVFINLNSNFSAIYRLT